MKVHIFRVAIQMHSPLAGKYFRMARQTLTVVGYQTIRQWVLVECSKEGWVTQGADVAPICIGTLKDGYVANQPAAEAALLEQGIFLSTGTVDG